MTFIIQCLTTIEHRAPCIKFGTYHLRPFFIWEKDFLQIWHTAIITEIGRQSVRDFSRTGRTTTACINHIHRHSAVMEQTCHVGCLGISIWSILGIAAFLIYIHSVSVLHIAPIICMRGEIYGWSDGFHAYIATEIEFVRIGMTARSLHRPLVIIHYLRHCSGDTTSHWWLSYIVAVIFERLFLCPFGSDERLHHRGSHCCRRCESDAFSQCSRHLHLVIIEPIAEIVRYAVCWKGRGIAVSDECRQLFVGSCYDKTSVITEDIEEIITAFRGRRHTIYCRFHGVNQLACLAFSGFSLRCAAHSLYTHHCFLWRKLLRQNWYGYHCHCQEL